MLTKYNRRTVSASSGAVIGGAFVRFYNQNTGAPVTAYNDAAGTSPIGTIVTSGTNGEVEVFLPPGLYRITVAVGSDIVEEITHEPITSNAAIIEAKTPAIGIMGLDSPAGDSLIVTGSSGLSEFVGLDDFKSDLAFTTADVTEDSGFLYHTAQRVRDVTLFGLNLAVNAVISASDSILGALGKLQKQISDNLTTLTTHTANTANPHSVTKTQVGLGDVDNTSDVNKPVSTAQAAAIALKRDKSTAFNNKIVIFGSSVAYGTGATSNQGWAYMLTSALTGVYNVVNKSVGGDTTALLISRFYTDVVPENPGIVVIALSTANEGLPGSGNPKAVVEQYLKGIEKLIKMCRSEGYYVVLAGVYPNNSYTATEYKYLRKTEDAMQRFGVPYIGFLGTIDDGSGHWLTGTFADGGHPNDTGHALMFGAIDLSLFNRVVTTPVPGMVKARNIIRYDSSTGGTVPASVTLGSACKTVTASARVRRITGIGAAGQSILALEGSSSPPVRIRNPVDAYQVTDAVGDTSGIIASSVLSSDNNEHLLTITLNTHNGATAFYIDGVLIGTATISGLSPVTLISFGNRTGFPGSAQGYEYSDFMVWRTCLRPEQVKNLAGGVMPLCSQVIYSPIVDDLLAADSRLLNLALSDDDVLCGFEGTVIASPDNSKNRILINFSAGQGGPGGVDPDRIIFLADRGYIVKSVRYIHTTATAVAGATGILTKESGTSGGVGSGSVVATVTLDSAALTVQTPALANASLAIGDRLSFYTNSTVIADLRNVCLSIILEEV